jgi:hypothetical protein
VADDFNDFGVVLAKAGEFTIFCKAKKWVTPVIARPIVVDNRTRPPVIQLHAVV